MLQSKNNLVKKNEKKVQPLKCMIKQLYNLVKLLEFSFFESQQNDRLLLMSLRMDTVKENSLENRLHETKNENMELLNMVQLGVEGTSLKSCSSNISLTSSSVSTMSLVNLQYKYEELWTSHNGLLKILELRNNDQKKHTEENGALRQKIEQLNTELEYFEENVDYLKRKIQDVKRRKKEKISRLKSERETLVLVHDRLVTLLHQKCLEKNRTIEQKLKNTDLGVNGLLLKEIRKNNILTYENFKLQQEIEYLKTFLKISQSSSKSNSNESLCSEKTQKSRSSSNKSF